MIDHKSSSYDNCFCLHSNFLQGVFTQSHFCHSCALHVMIMWSPCCHHVISFSVWLLFHHLVRHGRPTLACPPFSHLIRGVAQILRPPCDPTKKISPSFLHRSKREQIFMLTPERKLLLFRVDAAVSIASFSLKDWEHLKRERFCISMWEQSCNHSVEISPICCAHFF